jgi:ATP-dependent 26S proteasome regulatory subunit
MLQCCVQDTFDPAVLRSGRFGMQIQFEAPDREGRAQLFIEYLMPLKLARTEVLQYMLYCWCEGSYYILVDANAHVIMM